MIGHLQQRRRRDAQLLGFAQAMCGASSVGELARRFDDGLPRLLHAPMRGMYFLDPGSGRVANVSRVNVSDVFLARYERFGRQRDEVLAHVTENRRAASLTSLMSVPEWLESPLYTRVCHLHRMRDVIVAPIVVADDVVGTFHISTSLPDRPYRPDDVRLADAVARLIATAVDGLGHRADLERQRDEAVTALELADTAVVVCGPDEIEPRLSAAARRLLAQLADPDAALFGLLAAPPSTGRTFRRLDVDLADGRRAELRAHSGPATGATATAGGPAVHGAVVTVLDLVGDHVEPAAEVMGALTPREQDVARLVATGLTDRAVAERLHLSHHTVSQHVKRIYRKLGIASWVELTALLVAPSRTGWPAARGSAG